MSEPVKCYKCKGDCAMTPICLNCGTIPIAQMDIEEMQNLLREIADCYFLRRSEGLLELMRRADRLSPPSNKEGGKS